MLKEFKEFAFKGNLVDMAVGFILGGAFATVAKSLVNNVIMPPIGLLIGGVDFTKLKWTLKEAEGKEKAVGLWPIHHRHDLICPSRPCRFHCGEKVHQGI